MRLPVALLSVACLTTILSGCVGHAGGLTAKEAADSAMSEGQAWAADAQLMAVGGAGAIGNVSTLGGIPLSPAAALDGHLPTWVVVFSSAKTSTMLVLNVTSSGAQRVAEVPVHGPLLSASAKGWSVDSPAALQAAEDANATLKAAVAAGGRAAVQYAVSPQAGAWEIAVATDTFGGKFVVDATDGKLLHAEPWSTLAHAGGLPAVGPLPGPIHATGSVAFAADPANLATNAICTSPTSQCTRIPFTVNSSADVTATLKWGMPANDFDLYIYQGDTQVSNDGINQFPPSGPQDVAQTSQVMHASLAPGAYQFVVVPWNAAQDTWTLDASFAAGTGAPA